MAHHEDRLIEDVLYLSNNNDVVGPANRRAEEMGLYIFEKLGHAPTKRAILLRRRVMRVASIEAICARMLQSTLPQWKADSTEFGALVLEFETRMKCIALMTSTRGSIL